MKEDVLLDLAAEHLQPGARVLDLGGPAIPSPLLAGRRVTVLREDEALAFLQAHADAPFDGVLTRAPSSFAPLILLLTAVRAALHEGGIALVADLAWQTAPTPELLRAFAPAPGRDKVRPIEGYEMQMEHAGFSVAGRHDVDRARWAATLAPEQRAAVEADTRGAARFVVWVLRPASE